MNTHSAHRSYRPNIFGDRIKAIGNTGSNSTREAIHSTEQGFAVGVHGALHITPYYGNTSNEGLIKHFESVLGMGPTIVYNAPGRAGQDISPSVMEKISGDLKFVGVKECMGNERIGAYVDKGLTIWSGNDGQFHDARWHTNCFFDGRNVELNQQLAPLMNWLFVEPNPIGLNTALAQQGLIRPVFRLPYVPLGAAKRQEFVQMVNDIGREHFVGDKEVQTLQDDDFLLLGRF